jgi:uncharacterized SAM-binding protein YcdF (DUF218 family)
MYRKYVLPISLILAGLFLFHVALIVTDGLHDRLGPADAMVILGSKVNPDGTLSNRLKVRLERGYELYRDGFSRKIIVSGGIGKEGHSEARVMAAYLESLSVPAGDILLDEGGKNTWQSALNFKRLADTKGFRSVILVSQYFHLTRAKLAFKKAGIKTVYAAHARLFAEYRQFYSILREVPALYAYWFRRSPV